MNNPGKVMTDNGLHVSHLHASTPSRGLRFIVRGAQGQMRDALMPLWVFSLAALGAVA
jgi:hypothetical protein